MSAGTTHLSSPLFPSVPCSVGDAPCAERPRVQCLAVFLQVCAYLCVGVAGLGLNLCSNPTQSQGTLLEAKRGCPPPGAVAKS